MINTGITVNFLEIAVRRFFSFGCSFTQYWRWPTWADAVGREYEHFENWGLCGAGNSYIMWSLIECNQRNSLTDLDTVWIMWTNTSREDRYVHNRWLEGGNVYWSAGSELPTEYVKKFACERGYLIRDMANIAAAKQLLDHWGCQYRFFSMIPLTRSNEHSGLGFNPNDISSDNADVWHTYQNITDIIAPSVYETVFNNNWRSRPGIQCNFDPKQRDFHPTPQEHILYLDHAAPGAVSDQTRQWMRDCDHQAAANALNWPQPNRPRRL